MHVLQVGVLLGYGLGPIIIHSDDTEAVCGNSTANSTHNDPSPLPELVSSWNSTIYNQIFYYLLAQAILSVLTLFITLAGETVELQKIASCCHITKLMLYHMLVVKGCLA